MKTSCIRVSETDKHHKRVNHFLAEILTLNAEEVQQPPIQLAFMSRAMVMATLPHSSSNELIFHRKNGRYSLTITANPKFGLPYGSIPRILLAWLTTEAVKNKKNSSTEINLGKSFSVFLDKLKLRKGGGIRGSITRVRDQLMRLLSCSISSSYIDQKNGICQNEQFHICRSFQLWWRPLDAEKEAFKAPSKIVLAKDFFEEITKNPVPIDFNAMNLLRQSPLQMDIYTWLTYRFSFLKKDICVPWKLLKNQFGCDYANDSQGMRNFKKKFIQALKRVWVVYPAANVSPNERGVTLMCSDTHIKMKKMNTEALINPVDN